MSAPGAGLDLLAVQRQLEVVVGAGTQRRQAVLGRADGDDRLEVGVGTSFISRTKDRPSPPAPTRHHDQVGLVDVDGLAGITVRVER
jgi:hypothetical protein